MEGIGRDDCFINDTHNILGGDARQGDGVLYECLLSEARKSPIKRGDLDSWSTASQPRSTPSFVTHINS